MNTYNTRLNYLMTSTDSIFDEKDFTTLSDQIEVHKYLINQVIPWTITWYDAAFSWLENVFHPIMQVLMRWDVRSAFAHTKIDDLFFAVSDHWYYLLEKNPDVTAQFAALDYAATYGKGLGKFVSSLRLPNKVA